MRFCSLSIASLSLLFLYSSPGPPRSRGHDRIKCTKTILREKTEQKPGKIGKAIRCYASLTPAKERRLEESVLGFSTG